jgi:nicotinamidase-related amidase
VAKTVLIALHYQNDILHLDGKVQLGVAGQPERAAAVADAAGRLLAAARNAAIPIVHVRTARTPGDVGFAVNCAIFRNVVAAGACIEGEWGSAFYEGLEPQAGEIVVVHNRVNGFFNSTLEMELRRLGATRLVMAGVATNSCVEHTARHAADLGYEVVVAEDACATARPEVHEAALFNIGLIGEVASVDELEARSFA